MSQLRRHLERDVLGWWVRHGVDPDHGGVFTCFSNDGELISDEKYTWSQGRWAWTCALAYAESAAGRLDQDPQDWRRRSLRSADFLAQHAFLDDDRTSFRLSADGHKLPDPQTGEYATSVFADLFAVLGLAGAARIAEQPDGQRLAQAERTLLAADRSIRNRTAPSAPYPVPPGYTDLAGKMMLAHVSHELYLTHPSAPVRKVLEAAVADLVGVGPARGDSQPMLSADTWWEFAPDARADQDTLLASHVTPGHLLECLWMLVHIGEHLPELATPPALLTDLALRAFEAGWDDEHGGLLRYTHRDGGRPRGRSTPGSEYETLVQNTWDTKLWWVHAEAMYAAELLARGTGSLALEEWSRRINDYTLSTFPASPLPTSGDAPGNEWIQIRDRSGAPLDAVVALPVKDPMHIARSLMLLNRLGER